MNLTKSTGLAAAMLLLGACLPAWAQGPPPTKVVTDVVKSYEFNDQINLIGRTEAKHNSRVVAEVSGQVVEIAAREGVAVDKGAALVVIGSERLQLALAAKEAEANQAKAQAEVAASNYERTKGLYNRELISESLTESDSALAFAAHERYNQLMAQRAQLAFDLEKSVIRAPFAGFTGRQLIHIGEWVNPGTPVFEMSDLSEIKITVDLPERYFGQLSLGSPVSVIVSSSDDKVFTGVVTGISPSAVAATHTFPVIVTVKNRGSHLGGGMLVRSTLSLKKRFSSLAVLKDAIVREGMTTRVFTVVEGKAMPIPVITSSTSGQMIAIRGDGLTEGMPVVIRGNERIFPGAPVVDVGKEGIGTNGN